MKNAPATPQKDVNENPISLIYSLLQDLRGLIDGARARVAANVNSEISLMYWRIGERINRELLHNRRAEYGKRIISEVSAHLQNNYGKKGFEERTIRRMMQFAKLFPDIRIVSTVLTQLSWSHFLQLITLRDEVQREFYLTMASSERWSVRELRAKIDGMLYERTAISGKPNAFIKKELTKLREHREVSPDLVFKSPYFLEFTGLKGVYSEKSLEDCLVAQLEQFIMELGSGFSFVERQKRMIIDGEDFYLDLLFYHRKLRRLVAVELKLGRFKAQYKGQMELYLRWLEKNAMEDGENSPLGLLLCSEGSEEQIELLQLDKSGIKVAKYMTELPSRKILREQLQKTLRETRARLESASDE